MTTYRILDLDNCLADDSWRIRTINWQKRGNPRYQEYHLLCGFDSAHNLSLTLGRHENILLTGRPNLVRGITKEWLERHHVSYAWLLMRNNSCEVSSVELKEQMLGWLDVHYDIQPFQIESAYDDHPAIVEMYARRGLNAFRRSIHGLDAYTRPTPNQEIEA